MTPRRRPSRSSPSSSIVGIDVGGTFTDVTAVDESTGRVTITKVPSRPRDEATAVLEGLRTLGIETAAVRRLVHGTTVGTNAVLERRGARVALITTAAPFQPEAGDQGPGAPYNAGAKFYQVYSVPTDSAPDLRISHVGYDRQHTSAKDINTYFPLARMQEAVATGRIRALTARVHGAPTNRSHRVTMETDASELLRRCREDGADAAVLAPT